MCQDLFDSIHILWNHSELRENCEQDDELQIHLMLKNRLSRVQSFTEKSKCCKSDLSNSKQFELASIL